MKTQTVFLCCIILSIIGVAAGVILWYRYSVKKLLRCVLQSINAAIDGHYAREKFDEGMMSEIEEKLNKFLSISLEIKNRTQEERNLVKALISDISHQSKTPLSNILLYSQMLQERQDASGDILEIANQIQKQSDKLSFLLNSLFEASYMETDMISIVAKEESIDKLIYLACQEVELYAIGKKIIIKYEESGLFCKFDLKWTLEAISNILDNALKYSKTDTLVEIKVISYEMFIRIDIIDSGIGIPEEEQGLIFKRFYRSPKVSSIKGLGIGLYLAREIISRQSGYIKVSSVLNGGSIFSVYLCR